MGGNLPGQSETLCGQPIQVAACGSHSAGMRTLLIGQEPVLNVAVRVDTPVAQKRPAAPYFFDAGEIDLGEHERLVLRGFRDDHAERIAHERVAPEFDPCASPPPPPSPFTAQPLDADAIHRGDPAAVGDRVAALDRLPGVQLLLAVLLLLRRMPAD